ALRILGYPNNPKVKIERFELLSDDIKFGQSLEIELKLSSGSEVSENLLIDYVIYHMKANNKLSPKVFKWCKKKTAKGELLVLNKKHPFRKISTRKYYSGTHEIHLQINGNILAKQEFHLTV
ncbi:MAG: DNA alkylation repair protein, partial [Gammaproteobacteria bacterium]|nr:DNA alkylation repair protein [Gammaproteobacteria bacterium]